VARPRLCAPLPPLPAPADVRLTRHAILRYWRRRHGPPLTPKEAKRELRALVEEGEVVRSRPQGYGGARFERPDTLVCFVVCDGHDPPLVLPVKLLDGRYCAMTTLLPLR
jgi:hypothetical protein